MNRRNGLLGLMALAGIAVTGGPALAADEPRLIVSYVECAPTQSASVDRALNDYAKSARKAGAASVTVLREAGRPGRLAVVELWKSLDAASAEKAAYDLQAAVGHDLQAPIDNRMHDPAAPLDLTPVPAAAAAFHVLMHIDVIPDGAPVAAKALVAQKKAALDSGALRFEVAVQTGRPNHFAVYEVWKTRAAYETYAAGGGMQAVRAQLTPVKGAPFDDRLYGAD